MSRPTIPIELYRDALEVFHWATKRHFQLWFTGTSHSRHRRTESVLCRLAKNGEARAVRYGSGLIYSLRRKKSEEFRGLEKVAHGLACTEGLVRAYRSRLDGEVIAEKFFAGPGSVPEWGIRYPDGKMLLFEFGTKHNFYFSGMMRGKLSAYEANLEKIEEKFQAKAVVLFVLDVPRSAVERYVGLLRSASPDGDRFPSDPFFFTDYKTFLEVPIGDQLKAPIYIWRDGKPHPLRSNA